MLAEKTLVGESYTAIIPITSNYMSSNTTATINDGVILGISTAQTVVEGLDIDSIYITGEDFTEVKVLAATFPIYLDFKENSIKPYNQVRFTVPSIINTGVFSIVFDQAQTISVLDQNGLEIITKQVTKKISIPVSPNAANFKIRFHSSKKRSVKLVSAKYSDKIYTDSCVIETQPIQVGLDLNVISIETCDNYGDKNVDIQYSIAINGGLYESFRPAGKVKLTSKVMPQSIIKTDKYVNNTIIPVQVTDLYNGVYRYYPDTLIPQYAKIILLSKKLGTDIYSASTYNTDNSISLQIFNSVDIAIQINTEQSVVLDGVEVQYNNINNGTILITRGYHTLVIPKNMWNETVDLDTYKITQVYPTYLTIVNRNTQVVSTISNIFSTVQASTNSLYLQLLSLNCNMFMNRENVFRKLDNTYLEYFYRNTNETIYLLNYSPIKTVNTIQIKATLISNDNVTCPYISKIMIRGL
jgi:hypothetical protein